VETGQQGVTKLQYIKILTSTGSSSYIALSMNRMDSSCSSEAQETVFLFFPGLVVDGGDLLAAIGGGVDCAGDSFRDFAMDLRTS
jgi:hypothetical protein